VVTELHAILRFAGERADFGLGVAFHRDGADESDDWPAQFDQLDVIDRDAMRPDLSGLVVTGLMDIRDALRELGLEMSFPDGGPRLEWTGRDERSRLVIHHASHLGRDAWRRFDGP
jgi:hypothetical protein